MRQTLVTAVLIVFWVLALATTAVAQFWPGYGYYGGYGAWGAYSSAVENSTSRYIAQQDRLQGQKAAMQQNALMQSGIRNTLTTQAQTRTQDILGQQQSNKDWWFQVQQQQMAQRRAMPALASGGGAPAAGFESAPSATARPEAATDIIKWPPVLCDPQFAQQTGRGRSALPPRSQRKGNSHG